MADNSYKLEFTLSNGRIINAGTIVAPQGEAGKNGVTFIPSVSEAGVLSWTNDGGLTNPDPVNIKGDAAVITESDVAGWGFTKNAGTITEIKMNGVSKGTSGVIDLGTVLTEHQSLENYVTLDGTQNIKGKKTVVSPSDKDNSNQIATTAWAGRRYKSIADFGFTSQTTVKAIVQKIIDNWYEYCTFACTNDNFNNFSDTPDGYGTLIIEVGSNALRPLISFTKQIGDSNSYKHWQANIVRGSNNQVTEIQWYEIINANLPQTISGAKTFTKNISISANNNINLSLINTGLLNGTNPTEVRDVQVIGCDEKNLAITGWRGWVSKTGYTSSHLYARSFGTDYANFVAFYGKPNAPTYDETSTETKNKTGVNSPNIWYFAPNTHNNIDLGASGQRWAKNYVKRLNLSARIEVDDTGKVVQDDSNGISFAGTKATRSMIRFANNDANTFGNGIVIGGGGVVIIGSGESSDNLYSALVQTQIRAGKTVADANTEVAQSEQTYIASDNNVRILSKCNTIADRKELAFNTLGQLVYTPTAGGTAYTYTLPAKTGTLAETSDINNGTLTIQKNGTNVATFTANQSGNSTADIEVPTALSELTDDIKVIKNNSDKSNVWAFSGGGNVTGASSTADSCVAIGLSQTRYEKSIRIGTAIGQTPTNQSVTQIGVNNYTSSGRALYLGAGYTGFTYMNAAGSSWTSASDIRDKTDIQNIDHALDFIKKLKPITYVMNDRERYLIKDEQDNPILDENGKQQYDVEAHKRGDKKKHRRFAGLSAQDTYQAMLDCYDNNSNYAQIVDNNKFDHPDDEYIEQYSMSYERLVPFLIKAIQEQQAQIDALKIKMAS